jgi:hypothetical protein
MEGGIHTISGAEREQLHEAGILLGTTQACVPEAKLMADFVSNHPT